jgi:hypothetical protein
MSNCDKNSYLYWYNWSNLSRELLSICENNILPSRKVIREKLGPSAATAIDKKFGGTAKIATKLSLTTERKSRNYWNDLNNVISAVKSIITGNRFPSLKEIQAKLGQSISKPIFRLGGIKELSRIMGYDSGSKYIKASDGHFLHSINEYFFDEYLSSRGINHEVNKIIIPNKTRLKYDFKIGSIFVEIWGFNPNSQNNRNVSYALRRAKKELFYKEHSLILMPFEYNVFTKPLLEMEKIFDETLSSYGIDVSRKGNFIKMVETGVASFILWSKAKVEDSLNKLINKLGRFPTIKEMMRYEISLYNGVRRYGGTEYFINKFECTPNKTKDGFWTEEKVLNKLKLITVNLNKFPSFSDLEKLNEYPLINGIRQFGGIYHFQDRLNINISRHRNGYWTFDKVELELKKLISDVGHFPRQSEIKNTTLFRAIRSFGGLPYFRQIFNI